MSVFTVMNYFTIELLLINFVGNFLSASNVLISSLTAKEGCICHFDRACLQMLQEALDKVIDKL